jgi:hypothetical protein
MTVGHETDEKQPPLEGVADEMITVGLITSNYQATKRLKIPDG